MKISSSELADHLNKTLHSIYFISGVEDLLIIESLDTVRKVASNNDYTDKTTFTVSGQFNWSEVDNCFKNQSLFGGKQFRRNSHSQLQTWVERVLNRSQT